MNYTYNSYGFEGKVPEGAIAGIYDCMNGVWTGYFCFSEEEIKIAEKKIKKNKALSVEEIYID